MLTRRSIFYTTPAFVMGILLLNLRPLVDKLFATAYFTPAEVVLMGTVNLITFIPECIVLATSYAIQTLTARYIDDKDNIQYFLSGLMVTGVLVVPILVLLGLFPVSFIKFVSRDAPTHASALLFFRLRLVGCAFQCLIFCLRGYYSAYRNNRIFFTVIALSLATHCLCNRLFLQNTWFIGNLGIYGLGLSYCISMAFGLAIYCDQFLHDMTLSSVVLPGRRRYTQLLRFSMPLTAHSVVDHIGTTFIFSCTGHYFGMLPLASLHLLSSIQGISPGAGFGLTALTEVSRAYGDNPRLARRRGETILFVGSGLIGLIGCLLSIKTQWLLELTASGNQALQAAAKLPVQMMLITLFLHVGCQVVLKILQAIDQTVASVSINLSFIYGFRIPLLFSLRYFSEASLVTVMVILSAEKCLKLTAMFLYWHWTHRRILRERPVTETLSPASL